MYCHLFLLLISYLKIMPMSLELSYSLSYFYLSYGIDVLWLWCVLPKSLVIGLSGEEHIRYWSWCDDVKREMLKIGRICLLTKKKNLFWSFKDGIVINWYFTDFLYHLYKLRVWYYCNFTCLTFLIDTDTIFWRYKNL